MFATWTECGRGGASWQGGPLAAPLGWLRITVLAARAMLRRRELPPGAVIKVGRRVRLRTELVKAWVLKRKPA